MLVHVHGLLGERHDVVQSIERRGRARVLGVVLERELGERRDVVDRDRGPRGRDGEEPVRQIPAKVGPSTRRPRTALWH